MPDTTREPRPLASEEISMHDDEPTIDDAAQEWFQREPLDSYADYLRDMADAENVGDEPPADFEPANCYVPGFGWRIV